MCSVLAQNEQKANSSLLPDIIIILKSTILILHRPSFSKFFISAIVIVVPSFMSIHYIALEIWHFEILAVPLSISMCETKIIIQVFFH